MKKKNNKKIKFKLGNNLALWVLIILGSFFIVQSLPNSLSSPVEVEYNDYREYLESGKIDHIRYGQNDKIIFSLKNDENKIRKYSTGLDESEKEDWVKYGTKIEIDPKPGLGLMDVIFNIAPWFLIIFFWFFMTRRMQGGGGQGGIFSFCRDV